VYLLSHSQNYLHDKGLVRYLVKQSSITDEDLVIEVGPGKGILTESLAERAKHVHAIEKDMLLSESLTEAFSRTPNVTVHSADFLTYRLPANQPYKIFSNIPFTITADLIRKLLAGENPPLDSYLILQREAAEKFAGQPFNSETLTSLLYKPWFRFSLLRTFKPTDFIPVPKVTAVLLRIEKRSPPLIRAEQTSLYKDFITYGFTRNRLSLKKNYEQVFGHVQFTRLAQDLSFSSTARPTDITFEQWLGMFAYFTTGVSEERKRKIMGALKKLQQEQQGLNKIHRNRRS
jgi:16S rRNA A1518/A1519 N6-dimethyltransferase RsmA/KsgA/DIM1 with predicted DNA glycosylase/AP lyase activity